MFNPLIEKFQAFNTVRRFTVYLEIVKGNLMSNWWRKGTPEEDNVVAEAAEELVKGVTDADMVNRVDLHTGVNLRDQVTIEEIEDWAKDRDLRRMKNRN